MKPSRKNITQHRPRNGMFCSDSISARRHQFCRVQTDQPPPSALKPRRAPRFPIWRLLVICRIQHASKVLSVKAHRTTNRDERQPTTKKNFSAPLVRCCHCRSVLTNLRSKGSVLTIKNCMEALQLNECPYNPGGYYTASGTKLMVLLHSDPQSNPDARQRMLYPTISYDRTPFLSR